MRAVLAVVLAVELEEPEELEPSSSTPVLALQYLLPRTPTPTPTPLLLSLPIDCPAPRLVEFDDSPSGSQYLFLNTGLLTPKFKGGTDGNPDPGPWLTLFGAVDEDADPTSGPLLHRDTP